METILSSNAQPRVTILNDLGLMTPEQLAAALDVNTHTLMTWRREGKGPDYTKLGKAIFYRREDVLDWIKLQVTLVHRSR